MTRPMRSEYPTKACVCGAQMALCAKRCRDCYEAIRRRNAKPRRDPLPEVTLAQLDELIAFQSRPENLPEWWNDRRDGE